MFKRARLRLTLLYIALMAVTLALVAGGILVLGARQAQRSDDLGLRLRAEGLAQNLGRRPEPFPPPPGAGPGGDPNRAFFGRQTVVFPEGARRDELEQQLQLERQGIVTIVMPVVDGQAVNPIPITDPPASTDLPSLEAANNAVSANGGRYETRTISGGQVRLYSLPIVRNGVTVGVVQSARSSYFVNETIQRLVIGVAGLGVLGLMISGLTGFWLAGRTLQPIAAAMERQRQFTADASHELRTPLSLIRGNAELLSRHPDEPIRDYDDVVSDIVDESDRLGRLVSDLLTLARADSGHIQVLRNRVNLSMVAAELVQAMEPLARAKGLALRSRVAPDAFVIGDADRLRQLGVILLDNAIRYTQSGAVTVQVAREGHHSVVLTVNDSGPGIAAEHLPRLFDRFYRTDAARSAEQGGTGLGLAIARWIVEAHHGRIDVDSELGRGSTFTVHLPRATAVQPAPDADGDTAREHEDVLPGTAAGTKLD